MLNSGQPLYGSLFYRFIQTDNFYADRKPTPWRGRALFLPDLAIGRLVESPTDINHYLNGYLTAISNPYTIRGDLAYTPNPAHFAGALVTGYDFTTDEAQAIGGLYQQYGFKLNGSPSRQLRAERHAGQRYLGCERSEQPVVQRPAAAADQFL